MIFPILEERENMLVDVNGNKSWVYEVFPPDIEQLDDVQISNFMASLKSDLNALKEGDFFRFERLGNRFFLNTSAEHPSLQNILITPLSNPIYFSLGSDNFLEDVYLGDDYIKKAHVYERYFYLEDLPSDYFEEAVLYGAGDFLIQFEKVNESFSKKQIERRRNQLISIEHERVSNYREDQGREEIEELKKGLDVGSEYLWKIEVWFKVRAISEEELYERSHFLLEMAKKSGLKIKAESVRLEKAFLKTLWGVRPTFKVRPIKTGVISSVLAALVPSHKDRLMNEGFRLESISGFDLYYDISADIFDNGHLSIAGATGSGKSLFAQYVVNYYLEKGSNAIILDKGRSFEKLCRWHGGKLLGERINFLEVKNPTYLKELVLSLMDGDLITKEEEGHLFNVIKEGVEQNKFETHAQFVSYLEKNRKGIKNYFSEFLDITTDEKNWGENNFIFCELDNIPEKFHTPIMLFLFEKFIQMPSHKIFVFEEIHKILKTNGERVAEYFRTMRKKGASCISITQSVNDANMNDLNRVIWENSEHYAIFKHRVQISREYLNDFQLFQVGMMAERDSLTNKNAGIEKKKYAEFLLTSSHFSKTVRLRINPLEYEIFNTTKNDLDSFLEWESVNKFAFNGDFKEMIKAYTRIKHGDTV